MSRIDKLSIQGIRSFSPSNREAIQFNTPLTLIVGYNGSGKTTIIECLKYATTGELPPNSKGGAFIYDPKLCGEKEVLAQVKLSFTSASGSNYVVTRSLQLTVKKTTRSMKTLEGNLVIVNHGERSVVSTRVAQLDEEIPRYLGVSPAILDAVIFCHQDESLWPMSEPSALKKRFDEIFEAMKYTKVIDNLKALRKRKGEELSRLKIFEEQDRINKEKGDKAEKQSRELQALIEEDREKCRQLTEEMRETQDESRKKHEQANSYLSIVQELQNKRDQLQYREEAVSELKMTLEELTEDDATLEQRLAEYEGHMARYRAQTEENQTRYADLQQTVNKYRHEMSTKQAEKGKLQSDKEKYERQIQSRGELIQTLAGKHNIHGFENTGGRNATALDDKQVEAFQERLQKLLQDKKRDLERLQLIHAKEVDKTTTMITELEGNKAARAQDRVFAKQRMAAIEKRLDVLYTEIRSIDVDEGSHSLLNREIEEAEERLQKLRQEIESGDFGTHLQQENETLRQFEAEAERLNTELMDCTRKASERAQLDYRKKELNDRRNKLNSVVATWKEKLDHLLTEGWTPDSLDALYHEEVKRQTRVTTEQRQGRDQHRDKLSRIQFRLKTAKDTLQSKAEEASTSEQVLTEFLVGLSGAGEDPRTVEDYPEELKKCEQVVEELRAEISLWDALQDYYTKCQEYLNRKNACRLCERAFDETNATARTRIQTKIQKQLEPTARRETEHDLEEAISILSDMQRLRSQYDTFKRLQTELPTSREEVASLETEYTEQERLLELAEEALAVEDEKVRELEALNKTIISISQTNKDVKDGVAQVERIAAQQVADAGSGHASQSRSIDEIHELQAASQENLRSVKARIQKLTQDRQRLRDQASTVELERSELKNKLSKAELLLQKKSQFEKEVQSLKEESGQQKEKMASVDAELEAMEPQIQEARALREDTQQRGRVKEQAAAEERDTISNSYRDFEMLEMEIQSFVRSNGASLLVAVDEAIGKLEDRLFDTETEITNLTAETNKLKQDLDNGDRTKKNVSDNLNYRKNVRLLQVLRREITDLEARDADDDYERLIGEARGLESHYNRLLAERGAIMGSMKTRDEQLRGLLQQWDQEYKDAGSKYRESHIKVETTKAAIDDIGHFSAALDKAIMQYHSLKMEELNRIAGELWQSTYQGTDIDTIRIRSDAETATGKRNYNYRVCMVKQDTEMDMRGRCSAGQKVLASIIIRLALAESFGVNCGLIALDEPTTNLDHDNIKSLAQSLHNIIKARQAQSNFQLIVITHDEEFLRHMRCNEFCDVYYGVRRNERQNSIITRENINQVL